MTFIYYFRMTMISERLNTGAYRLCYRSVKMNSIKKTALYLALIGSLAFGGIATAQEGGLEGKLRSGNQPRHEQVVKQRLPKDIYEDAKRAHKQGNLEEALELYAKSTYFLKAAEVSLQLGRPEQARDFYLDAGDRWSAEQVGKKYNIDAPSYKSPVYIENRTIPQYTGSHELVTFISQREQGVTNSSDKKPVLATSGLTACISIVGYDSSKRVGFLTHYDDLVDLNTSFTSLLGSLPQDQEFGFDISIIGGDGSSVNLYRAIKYQLKSGSSERIRLSVSEEDVFGNVLRSVALDTRTGEKYVYDPKQFIDIKINIPARDGQIDTAKMTYNSFAEHRE